MSPRRELRGPIHRDLSPTTVSDYDALFPRLVSELEDYAVILLDTGGHVVTWNPGAQRAKGYRADEIIGQHYSVFYPPGEIAAGTPDRFLAEAAATGRVVDEGWRMRKDGQRFWASVVITAIRDEDGTLRGFGKVTRDLTERRRAEEAVHTAEARFRSAFRDAPTGLTITSADPSAAARFLDVNRAFCDLVGRDRETLLGMRRADLQTPADAARDAEAEEDLRTGRIDRHHGERHLTHASGDLVEVEIGMSLVRDAEGAPLHVVTFVEDVSARRLYEQQLRHMAQHDPLTGLFNRARFDDALQAHLTRVRRYGPAGAVLMIDLDHFKTVNDRFGHNAGDELLVSVARVLQRRIRDVDVVARFGGDEFAVLLTDGGEAEAQVVAADISDLIRQRVKTIDGSAAGAVTVSIGITVVDDAPGRTGPDLLAEADVAMYSAKEDGRNRISAYVTEGGIRHRRSARMTIHHQIDAALADDRFVLDLQPVVALGDGVTESYEALLRMVAEDGTLVPPAAFVYVAERFDQIIALDRWVVGAAARLVTQLPAGIALEVNLSGRSLADPDLARFIGTTLAEGGVDPGRVIFEITETAAIKDIRRAREFAEELMGIGCRFALDDFGAGFGSFYYLKHLPFDFLKIDGEFVRGCVGSRIDQLVISSCVGLARGLGKATIAECVETEPTLRLLEALGVDHAQGYHLARPRASELVIDELRPCA